MPTVFGAELSLGLTRPQNGVADPEGTHLLILARDPIGYTRLCRALSVAHLCGQEKGRPLVDLETLAAIGAGALPDLAADSGEQSVNRPPRSAADHWVVLTGCRKGIVPAALVAHGPARATAELRRLQSSVRADQRGGGAVGPRRPARLGPQRRPGHPGRPLRRRDRGYQQRPLPPPGPPAAGHGPGRGAGPAQPGRHRRVAAGRGCRPPARRSRAGPAFRPLPRRGGTGRRARVGPAPSTWRWWPPTCHRGPPRRDTPR